MRIEDAIAQSYEIFGEKAQLEAVKVNMRVIQFCYKPSEAVQLEAVKKDGMNIQFIHEPSEAVQLAAVKQDGFAIQYIEDPSEEVMQAALDQNEYCKQYFKKDWLKNIKSKTKITVSEIEEKLGYKVEIIAEK